MELNKKVLNSNKRIDPTTNNKVLHQDQSIVLESNQSVSSENEIEKQDGDIDPNKLNKEKSSCVVQSFEQNIEQLLIQYKKEEKNLDAFHHATNDIIENNKSLQND